MMASNTGKVECVKMLMDRGAVVNMQIKVRDVIIHFAHVMQHVHVPRVPSSGR